MPEFGDFEVQGPLPATKEWKLIAPKVIQRQPKPAVAGTVCKSPQSIGAVSVSLTPAELAFRMAAVGYGAYAHYGMTWLLGGKPLSAGEIADLRRLTASRLSVVHRAYRMSLTTTAAGLTTVDLSPRSIYPLIESSERVSVSFVLGCAMAEVCAPVALNTRPGFTTAKLWHLFHTSLLQAASSCATVIQVSMSTRQKTDFVAVDSALGTLHVIEAKGTGDEFNGASVADGLSQCDAVKGIRVMGGPLEQPASLNVCVSYVYGGKVRSAVYELSGPSNAAIAAGVASAGPSPEKKSATTDALELLLGTKLMGTYLLLRGADVEQAERGWTTFDIGQRGSGVAPIRVALQTDLWRQLDDFWNQAERTMAKAADYVKLSEKLSRAAAVNEWLLKKRELETRLTGLGRSMLQTLDAQAQRDGTGRKQQQDKAPEGFVLSRVEPWLAFESAFSGEVASESLIPA